MKREEKIVYITALLMGICLMYFVSQPTYVKRPMSNKVAFDTAQIHFLNPDSISKIP